MWEGNRPGMKISPSGSDATPHSEWPPSHVGDGQEKELQRLGCSSNGVPQSPQSPSSQPASPRVPVAASTAETRRVELVGQAVTSTTLAEVVEATLGSPHTSNTPSSRQSNVKARREKKGTPLWILTIRQCQLSSLLPVAGLLHHLDGLMSLEIHGVSELTLFGVERVLNDAGCLRTITLHGCGLVRLPSLQSGSIKVLDLSNNAIESTAGLETLYRLKELNLAGNNIRETTALRPLVPLGGGCLHELNLSGNPVQYLSRYRDMVLTMLPSIQYLDGTNVTRPWRMRMDGENHRISKQNHVKSVCSTPPRARGNSVDGYFSDGAAWTSLQKHEPMRSLEAGTNQDPREKHAFVRGLAGLGLIWVGAPRARTHSSRGSPSVCSSPGRVNAARGEGRSDELSRSGSLDGVFGEMERSRGLWGASRSPRRFHLPSPERCRQIEADNTRSKPRVKPQPQADWDSRLRHHHKQESIARNIAKARTARVSRDAQAASIDRLAQPVRLLRPADHGEHGKNSSKAGSRGNDSRVGIVDMHEWGALFNEAMLAESLDLVDRPTAWKGPDGRWQGVVTSVTGERKAIVATVRGATSRISPVLGADAPGHSDVNAATTSSHGERPVHPIQRESMKTETCDCATTNTETGATVEDEATVAPRQAENTDAPSTPTATPVVTSVSPLHATSSENDERVVTSLPSESLSTSPVRATLMLPDEVTLRAPNERVLHPTDHPVDFSTAEKNHTLHERSDEYVQDEQGLDKWSGDMTETLSLEWSTGPPRSWPGEARRSEKRTEARPRSISRNSPPQSTRTPRVLKTSRDFARTIRRIFKVELSEEEARSLYRQLDADRDGALGAEDLLRGASTIASFISYRSSASKAVLSRQGPMRDRPTPKRSTRVSTKFKNCNQERGEFRRGDARSTRRSRCHQGEFRTGSSSTLLSDCNEFSRKGVKHFGEVSPRMDQSQELPAPNVNTQMPQCLEERIKIEDRPASWDLHHGVVDGPKEYEAAKDAGPDFESTTSLAAPPTTNRR